MIGIIRRIDELGRIVLPKEIRKLLNLSTGDALEIYLENGVVKMQKYLPLSKNLSEIENIANGVLNAINKSVVITDSERVLVANGSLSYLKGEKLSKSALEIINKKSSFSLSKKDGASPIKITENEKEDCFLQIIMPILSGNSNAVGLISVCGLSENENFDVTDVKLLKFVSEMLYGYYLKV